MSGHEIQKSLRSELARSRAFLTRLSHRSALEAAADTSSTASTAYAIDDSMCDDADTKMLHVLDEDDSDTHVGGVDPLHHVCDDEAVAQLHVESEDEDDEQECDNRHGSVLYDATRRVPLLFEGEAGLGLGAGSSSPCFVTTPAYSV